MAYNRILGSTVQQQTTTSKYNRILGAGGTLTTPEDTDYNKGGFLGGVKYLGGQAAAGAFGVLEGGWDYLAGGAATLFGNDDYAKRLMENDISGSWSQELTDEYNPNKAMSFAGDVASGLGQSSVGLLATLGVSALVVASGGTLAPAAAAAITGGVIGVGAAGKSTAQAYKKTGKLGLSEFAYGTASGLLEGGLEAVTGAASKAAKRAISPFAKTAASKLTLAAIGKTMLSEAAGEAFEEGASTFIDPYLQRGLGIDKNAQNATSQEIFYSMGVGAASGALMSGGTSAATSIRAANLGNNIVSKGKTDVVLERAKMLTEYADTAEDATATPEVLQSLKASYTEYNAAKNKNGLKSKALLGEMSRSIAYIEVSKGVQASKAGIVKIADDLVSILQQQGFEYTADDIKANKDDVATKLAIQDFVGKMLIPTEQYTEAIKQGKMAQSEANYTKWQSEVDDATKQELGQTLGIDMNTATYYDMQHAMSQYDPAAIEAQNQTEEQSKAEERAPITAAAKQSYKMSKNAEKAMKSFREQFAAVDKMEVTPKQGKKSGTVRKQLPALPSKVTLNQGEAELYRADNGVLVGIKRTDEGYLVYAEKGKEGLGGTPKAISEAQLPEVLTAITGKDFVTNAQEKQKAAKKPKTETKSKVEQKAKAKAEPAAKVQQKPAIQIVESIKRIKSNAADAKARKFVKDFDLLPVATRGRICEAIISGNQFGVEENTINAACNIMTFRDVGISFSSTNKNGIYSNVDGKRQIIINPNTNVVRKTIIHELAHDMEGVEGYDKLRKLALKEVSETKQKATEDAYTAHYEKIGKKIDDSIIQSEITADYLGEKLGDSNFLRQYVNKNLTFFQKAKRWISDFAAKLKNKEGYTSARYIEMVYNNLVQGEYINSSKTESVKKYSYEKTYEQQIDEVYNDTFNKEHSHLSAGNTPEIFVKKAGLKKLPLLMRYDTTYLSMFDKGELKGNYHNLGVEIMKQIPKALEEPSYILSHKNPQRIGAIISVKDTRQNQISNRDIYFAIEFDTSGAINGKYIEANLIVTAFSPKNAYIQKLINENTVIYKKDDPQVNPRGQFPSIVSEASFQAIEGTTSISNPKAEINTESVNKSQNVEKYSLSDQVLTEIPQEYKPTKREAVSDQFLAFQIAFVNQQAGVERLGRTLGVKGIEAKVQAARSAQAAAEEMLGGSQWSFDGTKKYGDGLQKIMKPIYKAGVETKQSFFTYLLHKHNISRMEQDKPVFGYEVTAENSINAVIEYEKSNPEFAEISKKLNKYQDNLLQLRVDSGLVTQEAADMLRKMYPNYVPTFRDVEKAFGTGSLSGKYNLAVKQTIKKAKGGNQPILPIDIMIARQTIETVKAARVNALANALYSAAVAKNDFSQIEVSSKEKVTDIADTDYAEVKPKNNEITFFRAGERITMKVSKEVFAGFEAFSPASELSNPLVTALRKVNNTFKRLVTSLNPAFLLRNSARDIQDAGMYSKYIKSFPKNYIRAISEIKNNGDLWQRYKAMGGIQSSIFEFERGFIGEQNKFGLTKAEGKLLNKGLQAMENANMFVEQLPRLAEFISSIEAGNTTDQALLDAADVTVNFARTGKVTRSLNSTLIPFLNPAIQGFSKMIRTITAAKSARQLGGLIAKAFILGILPQLLNQLMYDDDEDYQVLTDYVKENNFLFKIDIEGLAEDKFVKIPKGRVSSFLAGLVLRSSQIAKGEEADWKGYVENALTQITPVDAMSRTILSPFKDVATNTTWYGGTIEGAEFDSTAPAKRYDESTSSIAIALGKVLNYSPKKINYLLDQYSGVIGDIILPATTAKAENNLFSSSFLVNPVTSNKLSTKFYDTYDKLNYKKTDGNETAAFQIKFLNKAKSGISTLYKEKSIIQSSNLTDKEKIAQTEVIQALINQAYKTALADLPVVSKAIEATESITDPDIRYVESVRLVYGAERALKDYNTAVYDKAATLNNGGVDYETFYNAYFTIKSIESDKDADGETVSGSRKEKIVNYLNTLGIPDAQKLIILYSYGYTTTNKKTLAQYITRLQISTEEKTLLAETCGFTVKNGKIVL